MRLAWPKRAPAYVASDAEPASDTFIGHLAPAPADPIGDAIARAHAARAAIRELDGQLPDQPLAVTVQRAPAGAIAAASELDVAAFAIGNRCVRARLAPSIEQEHELARALARVAAGEPAPVEEPLASPFVTVALGDEPAETARHAHRRGWRGSRGPWLGLSRAGSVALVSTCHMIVDGYGHAWLAARIAEHARRLAPRAPGAALRALPRLAPVAGARPLAVAWQPVGAGPRALPLAYALGRLLHQLEGRCPPFQIPVAPGALTDPARRLRRVIPAVVTVRFEAGVPEPYPAFAARVGDALAREAAGAGLISFLLAAARGAPAPLSWKRRAVAADRPRWLDRVADLLGGRACVSRIRIDEPAPPACAVSSPPSHDGWVVTVVDDGRSAGITLCGAGASEDLLHRLLTLLPG
ncbi:MAG: hypothetical protein ACM31C_28575 [Acidobacteriota bacterium]